MGQETDKLLRIAGPPVRDEGCTYYTIYFQRTPNMRVAGVTPVIAEHKYVTGGHDGGLHGIVRPLAYIRLVKLDAVDVHAAVTAVIVRRAYRVRVGLDLYSLTLDSDDTLDEVLGILRSEEDDYIAPLRPVKEIVHICGRLFVEQAAQEVGVITIVKGLVHQY